MTTQLEITVKVPKAQGGGASLHSLEEGVLACAAELADDLGLPVDCTVSITQHGGMERTTMEVDGECCRLPWSPTYGGTPTSALKALREGLHRNRVLLASRGATEELWRGCHSDLPCPAEFQTLIRRLVHYRVGMSRLLPLLPRWQESTPDDLFEEAFSSIGGAYRLHLSPELYEVWNAPGEGEDNGAAKLKMMADGLFYELGGYFARCEFDVSDELAGREFRVQINDLRTQPLTTLSPGEVLVNDTVDRLTLLNIAGTEAVNPANGNECATIPGQSAEIAEQAGLTTWDSAGYLVLVLSSVLRREAASLLSLDIVRLQLGLLQEAFPALVDRISAPRLVGVLRGLLAEGISIRNLRLFLERLLDPLPSCVADQENNIVFSGGGYRVSPVGDTTMIGSEAASLVEAARMSAARYISHKYTRGANTLVVYLLEPAIEQRLREQRTLTREEHEALISAVATEVGSLPATAQNPVMLTTVDVRRRLRHCVEAEFPDLAVLSYSELSPDMNIQPIARISYD